MSELSDIIAIIPAAGRSRRMGRDKPSVLVGGVPMLRRVLDAFRGAGVNSLVVVARSDLSLAELGEPPPRVLFNDDPRAEMIDSVRLALAEAPATATGFMVCPADVGRLDADSVSRCAEAFLSHPQSLVVACHGGKRGHPVVLPRDLLADVRSSLCDGGLNQLVRHHAARVLEVECASAGVLDNINAPNDLADRDVEPRHA